MDELGELRVDPYLSLYSLCSVWSILSMFAYKGPNRLTLVTVVENVEGELIK